MIYTRPDFAFALRRLFQHMEHPSQNLWTCLKRVLQYINGTEDIGHVFGGSRTGLNIQSYCDADWAGCTLDRQSTNGYVIIFAGAASHDSLRNSQL